MLFFIVAFANMLRNTFRTLRTHWEHNWTPCETFENVVGMLQEHQNPKQIKMFRNQLSNHPQKKAETALSLFTQNQRFFKTIHQENLTKNQQIFNFWNHSLDLDQTILVKTKDGPTLGQKSWPGLGFSLLQFQF